MLRQILRGALVLLALAAPATADHDDRGVTLYRDAGYKGASETFYAGDEIPRFDRGAIGNDTATSVRVGRYCQVTLYEHIGFRGDSVTLTEDVPDLRFTEIGNDRASSLVVECRRPGWYGGRGSERPGWYQDDGPRGHEPGETDWYGRRGAALYSDDDFRGREELFVANDPDLRDNAIRQDTASSLRLAPGCSAILYSDIDYRGTSAIFTASAPTFENTPVGNDRASSIEVRCGGVSQGVVLYADNDYGGRNETFLDDDPQLANNSIRQDRASSVRVAPGCAVTLYEHPNYEGRSTTLREDTPYLGDAWIGNDTVSSIRVDCRPYGRRR